MAAHVFDPSKVANLDSPERRARIPAEAIVAAARLTPAMSVADVGSGAGYFSLALLNSQTPPVMIEAVDASKDMNQFFQEKLKTHPLRERVHIHEGKGECLPLRDASIDLAILGNVFHEFDDSKQALREVLRVLKKCGRVLILDWAIPTDTSIPPKAGPPYDHRRSEDDVKKELQAMGFDRIETHPGFIDTFAISAKRA
jgi:ubiquinone/menaquinone biosynthesis C-methylase UbiE